MSAPDSYLYIRNVGDSASGKTCIWFVYSQLHGDKLGEVKWYGRWRQYAFFPSIDTIWNDACLIEVAAFVTKVTKEHRARLI